MPDIDDNANIKDIEQALYKILESDIYKIKHLLDKHSKEILEIYLKKFNNDKTKLEMKFYKIYFTDLYKIVKKSKNQSLLDLVGKQIDLLNILWIIRAKKYYNLERKSLNEFEIPINHKLSKEVLEQIVLNQENIQDIIEKTIYSEINFETDNLEVEIQNYLYKLYINYFKTKAFCLTMVIAYFELRQIQIKNIIAIMEGIRYSILKERNG